jgi:hypothetical protein
MKASPVRETVETPIDLTTLAHEQH